MAEHNLGGAVRSARTSKGLSLRALAGLLGVSPATLSAIENNRTPLTVGRLQEIAGHLDVPSSRLLRGEITAPPTPARVPSTGKGNWRRFDELRLDPVLQAALQLFVRQGFHATSVREIAADAQMSVAGIYHHYQGKEQILVALLDLTMADIRWRLLSARDEGTSALESFELMVESLALFHAVRGDLAFLGASEMRGLSGSDRSRVTGLRNEVQHLLDEQAALALPGVQVRVPCRAIATMCTSLPTWFRVDGQLRAEHVAKEYAVFALQIMTRNDGRAR